MPVEIMWLFIVVGLLSYGLTGLMQRSTFSRKLIDIPNERSSHSTPTPRGGGVAIVITFLAALSVLALFDQISSRSFLAMCGAGIWVALIGFLDDRGHIPALWRLLSHFFAAIWALVFLNGLPPLLFFDMSMDLGWLGNMLAVLCLVWLLNLYNFMDGIDGIAGIEAVTVSLAGVILYLISPLDGYEWLTLLLLAITVLGFLIWNFPRAKIFMGDAGSGFIGIVLGIFSIQAAWAAQELLWGWVILLGAFITDATVTLVRRVMRGEKFYEAHRNHAYQYAARKYGSHVSISLAFGVINLFWLLPIAILVVAGWMDGMTGIMIAYFPLIWLAFKYKAGARELQEA